MPKKSTIKRAYAQPIEESVQRFPENTFLLKLFYFNCIFCFLIINHLKYLYIFLYVVNVKLLYFIVKFITDGSVTLKLK